MFAHYADNLKGLALIYEAFKETSFKKIEYIPPSLSQPIDTSNQWKYWVSYKYSAMRNFIKKSSRWNYEKEYRLFNEPNIIEAEKHSIKLRAIFYTLRFDETYLPILNKLNKLHYGEELEIKQIRPHHTQYKFVMKEKSPSSVCVQSWIYENIKK